jgi:hypothetical protein
MARIEQVEVIQIGMEHRRTVEIIGDMDVDQVTKTMEGG